MTSSIRYSERVISFVDFKTLGMTRIGKYKLKKKTESHCFIYVSEFLHHSGFSMSSVFKLIFVNISD